MSGWTLRRDRQRHGERRLGVGKQLEGACEPTVVDSHHGLGFVSTVQGGSRCVTASPTSSRVRQMVDAAVGNLRWERLLHYLAMLSLGVYVSSPSVLRLLPLLFAGLAVTCAWAAAIVNNDLADDDIDRISNPSRPLITGAWSRNAYWKLGWALTLLAVASAICVNAQFAICLTASLVVAFVYSTPPWRLRRFLGVSSALIGLASLCVALAGFVALGERSAAQFPADTGWFLFLALCCGANFKDVKDFAGDRHAGIATLVTLLGPRRGQIVAGGMVALAMLSAPAMLHRADLWLPSLFCSMVALYLSTRQPFREKRVLAVYFVFLLVLLQSGALRGV